MTFDHLKDLNTITISTTIRNKPNKSYLTTAIGLAFRKLDVFGYYKFVTAVKNINLLPDRNSVMKQKRFKAISGFAFKGFVGAIALVYVLLLVYLFEFS